MSDEVAAFPNQKLKNYLQQALDGFAKDPPDTDFQRGYMEAIKEISRMFSVGVV